MTILFVTHDLEEAMFLGTRVVVMSQHYKNKYRNTLNLGAMICSDYKLPRSALSTTVKKTAEFGQLTQELKRQIDPNYIPDVEEFNLKHPDSFHTLPMEVFAKG